MFGLPHPEEESIENDTRHRKTNCSNSVESGITENRSDSLIAYNLQILDLSVKPQFEKIKVWVLRKLCQLWKENRPLKTKRKVVRSRTRLPFGLCCGGAEATDTTDG